MKVRAVLLVVLLLLIYWIWLEKTSYDRFTPRTGTPAPHPLGVMTYNIQYLPWKLKDLRQLRTHTRLYPVIMLQEVFNRFSSLPIPDIFPEYYIARGRMKSINLVNSGLLTMSRYPILSQRFIEFTHYTSFSYDAMSNKGFLCCVLDTPQGHICFINTHTQSCEHSDYDPTVKLQLQQIFDYVRTLTIPYVVGGDFNIDYRQVPNEIYAPARVVAPPAATIYIELESGATSSTPKTGFRPYTLDYFFVHPGLQTQAAQTEQNLFSDHNPVFMLL